MPAATYELVVLGVGMTTALALLAIGAWAGYWAGTRVIAQSVEVGAASWIDERTKMLADLNRCVQESDHVSDQCATLAKLGGAWESLPAELAIAIDRLTKTTAGLAAQLRQVQEPAIGKAQKCGDSRGQPAEGTMLRAPMRLTAVEEEESASVLLTSEQISDAVGQRRKIDDSAHDAESKRYPYDCYQQLATWTSGDPPPIMEQFAKVRCHDISVSGISFFWPRVPDFESVIVSIGTGEKLIFMHAQICDHKAVFMHNDVSFLVECRYVRRMDELTAQWHQAELLGMT
jgi:hypothetical protein